MDQEPYTFASGPSNEPDEVSVQRSFEEFLTQFKITSDDLTGVNGTIYPYIAQIDRMVTETSDTLYVDMADVQAYSAGLAQSIEREYVRFGPALDAGVAALVARVRPIAVADTTQRRVVYTASFFNSAPPNIFTLRELDCAQIQRLLSISATVTRVTDVRPELSDATFTCEGCGGMQTLTLENTYDEPGACRSCQSRAWRRINHKSRFVDFQRLRVQENAANVPAGDIPLTMSVLCYGECVDAVKPGDRVRLSGTLVVVPDERGGTARAAAGGREGSGGGHESRGSRPALGAPAGTLVRGAKSAMTVAHHFALRASHLMDERIAEQPNVRELVLQHRSALAEGVLRNHAAPATEGDARDRAAAEAEREFERFQENYQRALAEMPPTASAAPDGANDTDPAIVQEAFAAERERHTRAIASVTSDLVLDSQTPAISFVETGLAQNLRDAVEEMSERAFTSSKHLNELLETDPMARAYRGQPMPSRWLDALTQSFAPHVFGHTDIKRGLLLMLVGGVAKTTAADAMRLRGDLNACIVGDPSTAKSMFLKFVSSADRNAVYTSGKASSAAGLTAAVVRDADTGEFTIEAGALILADNGVCAVDEFEKLDPRDQVAIHEAMEQQTVSISKAGIQATLNARASVLAAMNPVTGRYDRRRTLQQNVGLTPAILSRFDMIFVIEDIPDPEADRLVAERIVGVHARRSAALNPEIGAADLFAWISFARLLKPAIREDAAAVLRSEYLTLRAADRAGRGNAFRVTIRQLESLTRMSEALAKLHATEWVTPAHVREAARLLRASIVRVRRAPVNVSATQMADAAPPASAAEPIDDDFGLDFPMADPAAAAAPEPLLRRPAQQHAAAENAADQQQISYEFYETLSMAIVMFLQTRPVGAQTSAVVVHVLQTVPRPEFATVEDGERYAAIVRLVIDRLVTYGTLERDAAGAGEDAAVRLSAGVALGQLVDEIDL